MCALTEHCGGANNCKREKNQKQAVGFHISYPAGEGFFPSMPSKTIVRILPVSRSIGISSIFVRWLIASMVKPCTAGPSEQSCRLRVGFPRGWRDQTLGRTTSTGFRKTPLSDTHS